MENKITEASVKETFQAKISPVDIGVLYSLMVKRIAKGYSTSEVSFLMGYEDNAIERIEQLQFKELTILDIHHYTNVLEDGLKGVIINNMDRVDDMADYQVVRTIQRTFIHHEVFEILPDNTACQVFNLFEVNPEYKKRNYSTSYEMGIKEATEILYSLLEGAVFQSPETPLNIYRRSRRISGSEFISPAHIQAVLQDMAQSKGYPKFKRIKTKQRGCLYEKAF
ncbi:hypothetical protein [Mucilaginibacter paludis]|uniref:Uncharacterized protein n=1 Tax=Mucilaginibacter paludis DSM 18603 TaxID=714943 RepID=H1Y8N8_9SPHI|nr:hypothetical protein [Mucilaginibacter paludis]EHQ26910.1 hypothetical protein Mucpa_2799 [Mucilaginibacter paludis DSM 18603]